MIKCPTDVCIIYLNTRSGRRSRKYRRIDFLRRYLKSLHLNYIGKNVTFHCTLDFYKIKGNFADATIFLYHTITVYDYDLKIRPYYLQRHSRPSSASIRLTKNLDIKITTN
jgi:hypothetical protein